MGWKRQVRRTRNHFASTSYRSVDRHRFEYNNWPLMLNPREMDLSENVAKRSTFPALCWRALTGRVCKSDEDTHRSEAERDGSVLWWRNVPPMCSFQKITKWLRDYQPTVWVWLDTVAKWFQLPVCLPFINVRTKLAGTSCWWFMKNSGRFPSRYIGAD